MVRRGHRQQRHCPDIHTRPSDSANDAANDQGIQVGRCTTDGRTSLEHEDRKKVQMFGIELTINLAPESLVSTKRRCAGELQHLPDQIGREGAHKEARRKPRQLSNIIESLHNSRLNVGNNRVIESEQKA